jgi:uncharacterized protein (TIGR03435 family)
MRVWVPGFVCVLSVLAAAQPRPVFEVASIKPCQQNQAGGGRKGGRGGPAAQAGRLTLNCQTLGSLIRTAYLQFATGQPIPVNASGLPSPPYTPRQMKQALAGAPAWVETETFTIEAKPEMPQTNPMLRGPMLQALLEDRFQLKLHRETRDVPVYALTIAKGGPKLTPPSDGKCISMQEMEARIEAGNEPKEMVWICGAIARNREGVLNGYRVTAAELCRELSRILDRDVDDRTGLTAPFDLHMELSPADALAGLMLNGGPMYTPDPNAPAPDPPGTSVFPAVQKLGLKLEPAKAPGVFLVIDRVERPTGN